MSEKRSSKNPVISYLSSAWEEFGKVTWPTKEQTALLTAITIVVSLAVAFAIGLTDFGLNELYQVLLDLF